MARAIERNDLTEDFHSWGNFVLFGLAPGGFLMHLGIFLIARAGSRQVHLVIALPLLLLLVTLGLAVGLLRGGSSPSRPRARGSSWRS